MYAPNSPWGCWTNLNVCIKSICIWESLPLVSPEVLFRHAVLLDRVLLLPLWHPCKHCLVIPASHLPGMTGCYSHVQQLSLPTPLDFARGNDSPHIQSQLASLEHPHRPGLTMRPVFSGDLTLGFQKSSSKSWFGRISCFHNFSWQSVLRNNMQINHPRYFKTMMPPQWRWGILAFSVHILLLFFCISMGKSKSERQFDAFFFILKPLSLPSTLASYIK